MEEETEKLLGANVELSNWESQEMIKKAKEDDPEMFERSRQYVTILMQLEQKIKKSLQNSTKPDDLDFQIIVYNLFLTLSK